MNDLKKYGASFAKKDFEILARDRVFQGYFAIDAYKARYRSFDGSESAVITREIFERGDAAAVVPYDPDRDAVILIEQFRLGAVRDTESPWLLELPAGIIDAGETPENTVMREMTEETGISLKKTVHALDFLTTPGGSTEKIFLYVGLADSSLAAGYHGLVSESEDIRVLSVPLDEALALIDAGRIRNSIAIVGLQYLALHKSSVLRSLGQ